MPLSTDIRVDIYDQSSISPLCLLIAEKMLFGTQLNSYDKIIFAQKETRYTAAQDAWWWLEAMMKQAQNCFSVGSNA